MAELDSLKAVFGALEQALATGDLDGFYGAMIDDAVILDEDLPFVCNKAGFQDHIAFHGPDNWEGFAWKPRDMRFAARGGAGSVVGFSTFRGKPRGSGYRIRPMMFSQGWFRQGGAWKLASWHQGPIVGYVTLPSPA